MHIVWDDEKFIIIELQKSIYILQRAQRGILSCFYLPILFAISQNEILNSKVLSKILE